MQSTLIADILNFRWVYIVVLDHLVLAQYTKIQRSSKFMYFL